MYDISIHTHIHMHTHVHVHTHSHTTCKETSLQPTILVKTYLDDVRFGGVGKLGDKSFLGRHFHVDTVPVGVDFFIVN
jgi:hypothetical protein